MTPKEKTALRTVRPAWDDLLPSASDKAAFEDASAALEAGRYVRKLRTGMGLTQAQLAARIKVSQSRISAIEIGEGRDGPTYALLKRIAQACGANLSLEIEPGSAVAGVVPGRMPPLQTQPYMLQLMRKLRVLEETIVAVYDTAEQADAAVRDLIAAEVQESAISSHARTASDMAPMAGTAQAEPPREEGFWSRLVGGDRDYDNHVYDPSVEAGSTVISVRVAEAQVMEVSEILDRHNPIDIDERASGCGLGSTTTGTAGGGGAYQTTGSDFAATRDIAPIGANQVETLQLAEERLTIGKRLVNRGTTRIRRYVVETPVEEQVTLHDERVTLDRTPVSGTVALGAESFTDRTIEMSESREEAVISKSAHVTEEVRLRKESVDRIETVRDTVIREEVEIEEVPGEAVRRPSR